MFSLTVFSTVLPLLSLSCVKHQEPRFLIPILPSVVLMCSHKLRWDSQSDNRDTSVLCRWKVGGWRPLLSFWYAFNILAMVWFSFVHQAGVTPVQGEIGGMDHGRVPYINLVYSHTYMPPRHLLLQPKVLSGENSLGYTHNPRTAFLVHEMGSAEMSQVLNRLLSLISR